MGGVIQVQYIDLPLHDADSTPWANFKRPLLAPNMSTLSTAALAGTRPRRYCVPRPRGEHCRLRHRC